MGEVLFWSIPVAPIICTPISTKPTQNIAVVTPKRNTALFKSIDFIVLGSALYGFIPIRSIKRVIF